MAILSQKYRVTYPLDAEQAAQIDEMFEDLYQQLRVSLIGDGASNLRPGDLLYITSASALSGLAVGAASTMLRSTGTLPAWSTATWPNTAVKGDLIYASATNAFTTLADVATGNALISGGVGNTPSWGKIDLTTHITSTLGVTNGGTGFASYSAGDTIFAATGTTLSRRAIGGIGTIYRVNSSSFPAWTSASFPNTVSNGDFLLADANDQLSAFNAQAYILRRVAFRS